MATKGGDIEYKIKFNFDSLDKDIDKINSKIEEMRTSFESIAKMSSEAFAGETSSNVGDFEQSLVDVIASVSGLDEELEEIDGENFKESSGKVDEFGKSVEDAKEKGLTFKDVFNANLLANFAGKGISMAIDGLKKLTTESLKLSVDMEGLFADIEKTISLDGLSDSQQTQYFADLNNSLQELALTSGSADLGELMGISAMAGQLGVASENVLEFTDIMSKMQVATDIGGEEGAKSFAILANQVKASADDYERMGSTIVSLGNSMKGSESELLAMTTRVAEAGKQIKMSSADTLGFASSMVSLGIKADAGGSAISRVMLDMKTAVVTGSDELETFGNIAGMTGQEFKQAFEEDGTSALLKFVEGLGRAEERGTDAIIMMNELGISSDQEVQTLLALSSSWEDVGDSVAKANIAWEENTALQDEYNIKNETTEANVRKLKNTFEQLQLIIGNSMLDTFNDLVVSVADLGNQVLKGFKAGHSISEIVNSILLTLSTSIEGIFDGLEQNILDKLESLNSNILDGFETGGESLTDLVSNLIIGILDTISTATPLFFEVGGKILYGLLNGIVKQTPALLNSIIDILASIINNIIIYFPRFVNAGLNLLANFINGISSAIPKLTNALLSVIATIIKTLKEPGFLSDLVSSGMNVIVAIVNGLVNMVFSIIETIVKIIKMIIDSFKGNNDNFVKQGENIIKAIWNGIVKIANNIAKKFKQFWENMMNMKDAELTGEEYGATAVKYLKSGFEQEMKTLDVKEMTGDYGEAVGTEFVEGVMEPLGEMSEMGDYIANGIEQGGAKAVGAQKDVNDKILKEEENRNNESEKMFNEFFEAISDAVKNKYIEEFDAFKDNKEKEIELAKTTYENDLESFNIVHDEKVAKYKEEYEARLKALGIEFDTSQNDSEIQKIKDEQANRKEEERVKKEQKELDKKKTDISKAEESLRNAERELSEAEGDRDIERATERLRSQEEALSKTRESLKEYGEQLENENVLRQENTRIKELEASNKQIQKDFKEKEKELKEEYNNKLKEFKTEKSSTQNKFKKEHEQNVLNFKEEIKIETERHAERIKHESLFNDAILQMQNSTQEDIIELINDYNPKYTDTGKKQGTDYIIGQIKGLENETPKLKSKVDAVYDYIKSKFDEMNAMFSSAGSDSFSTGANTFRIKEEISNNSKVYNTTNYNAFSSSSVYQDRRNLDNINRGLI